MKANKLDCVRMKHEIQQAILEEMSSLTPEEQRRRTEERILADPILGPIWRRCRQERDRQALPDPLQAD
ncbi:MAG: hypothetical protein JXR96_14280 [Deltaproteobacteria bacterium]|nr:hypothetical protein [Deltaproteobacteria bacterium]